MKYLKYALATGLIVDLLFMHMQVIDLKHTVHLQEDIIKARLKKAQAEQVKMIQSQEVVLLRHTVGVQDRLEAIEAVSNEFRFQVRYFDDRITKMEPKVVTAVEVVQPPEPAKKKRK